MREKSIVNMVSLIALGLLVSGGIYYFRNSINVPFGSSASSNIPEQYSHQSATPAGKTGKVKSAGHRDRIIEEAPIIATQPGTDLLLKNGPRFLPNASDIPPHMPFPEIVERLGQPDVMATWSYEGKLNRKLIYSNKTASLEINVQNGYVVSARN